MAREGNALGRAVRGADAELLEAIADHADQLYGHLLVHDGILDPKPADFMRAEEHLRIARATNEAPPLAPDVITGAFQWLIPEFER